METGVSYFGSRDLRHVQADLADMVEHGCTYVVHCFTEMDLLYYRDTMRSVVAATHEAGLEAWLMPWGVVGLFTGESASHFLLEFPEALQVRLDGKRAPAACPNQPQTRAFLHTWLEAAAETGADVVLWDQPHFWNGLLSPGQAVSWTCRCTACQERFEEIVGVPMPEQYVPALRTFREASLLDLLAGLCRSARAAGLRNTLCLLPVDEIAAQTQSSPGQPDHTPVGYDPLLDFGIRDWQAAINVPNLDCIGCAPYWYRFAVPVEPFVHRCAERMVALARRRKLATQVWVQAFQVPAGREEELRIGIGAAAEAGVSYLAAWSYRGTESMSAIRCERPEVVWSILGEEFRARRALPVRRQRRRAAGR